MDKNLTPEEQLKLELSKLKQQGKLSDAYHRQVLESLSFLRGAFEMSEASFQDSNHPFFLFFRLLIEQLHSPAVFAPYHKKIRSPFDYYKFSLDFFRWLIDMPQSSLIGDAHLATINQQLDKGENVIFLANHQTESDPQAIAILLEKTHPRIAEEMIYVAGERVTTDPMAIPFSLGTDLLCIYSKRYIDFPPEKKALKQTHNHQTMELMSKLLREGGKIIYVAPSGGRDRKEATGKITPALFDPNSIEMFYLMAKKAKTPTHFYPLALDTYNLLPPPTNINRDLGEIRIAKRSPIHIAFGPECVMEMDSGESKDERRKIRADKIWNDVCHLYQEMCP